MRCLFRTLNGYPQHHASSRFSVNTNSDKDSTIDDDSVKTDLGVCRIKEKMGDGGQLTCSPFLKKFVKLRGALTNV